MASSRFLENAGTKLRYYNKFTGLLNAGLSNELGDAILVG